MNECFSDELVGFGERPSPYPIYQRGYRGQPASSINPYERGDEEFNPQLFEMRQGLAHPDPMNQPMQATELQWKSNVPDPPRVEGACLDPGRVLTNPGRFVAPQLIFGTATRFEFETPHDIEDSAPDPMVQRSFGQWTAAPDDMLHSVPKQLLDFDYQALSQQDIADRARLNLRKAMYGR